VQGWVEKSRLAELVAVLSSAVDRGDRELIESCYDEQSYDDHGGFKGSGREFAEYICAPAPGRDAGMLMHHLLGQSIFRVERDEAWGETFFIFHMFNDDKLLPGVGRYIDYFVRAGGTWKIRYRRVVPDWVGSVPAAGSPTMKAYVQAARDRTDPLYDRRRWHG
jgi:hypothetical protein